jgi:hypothetical protein
MKTIRFRTSIAVSLFALMAGGALAQTPPSALSGVAGVTFEGEIGGMSVWSVPGMTDLFAVTPDGRTIVRGAIFNGSGRDVGAAYVGSEPSPLLSMNAEKANTVPVVTAETAPAAGPVEVVSPTLVDAGEGFADLRGSDSCQSPILGGGPAFGAPQVAGWDLAGNGNPPVMEEPPLDANGLVDGAAVARNAERALEGFSEEERRETLLDLVNRLRAATTQEEFLRSIADWRAEIDRKRAEKGLDRLYTADGSAPLPAAASENTPTTLAPEEIITTVLPDVTERVGVTTLEPPSVTVTPLEAATADPVSAELPLEARLLEDARKNALWFSVGSNSAPAVYAFIDPTCPYSARAVAAISEQIGSGSLQLRVILAPVVSERAAGLIAGVLTADKPPLAFFDHEVALAESGRSELAPAEFTSLPGPIQAGIKRNFEMIRDYKIPGVPFFVYETAEGARVVSGAQEGLSFPGALVDPYTGTK